MRCTIIIIIFLSLVLNFSLSAQVRDSINTKGIVIPKKEIKKGVTRAVLVGISNYENEGIPDLQYADKDVEVYYDFLRSPAGGSIVAENIKLLTNEKASGGNVHKALYWLLKESQEDDQCIIYFSGHGDVETIYPDEPGHLLVYDSPSSIYQINSLRLADLKRIIRTLSEQKKSKVLLFADACRSGKLAGTTVSGAQATSAALATQFSNEVKIMSCQPDEYSIEGLEWGGGRGLFSFHFVEGLMGLADADQDNIVSLKEIQRYLEDRFDEDLTTQTQTPLVMGNRNLEIARVDKEMLNALQNSKNDLPSDALASIDHVNQSRGQGRQDELLLRFYEAIDLKVLLNEDEKSNQKSAEHYYSLICKKDELATKAPLLKGDLIFALQDEAQAAINRYLNVDYQEMLNRYKGIRENYERYPIYLSKASELLTESHYLYPQLKAKEIYFTIVNKRLKLANMNSDPEAFSLLEDDLVKALLYDPNAAYLWNELGYLLLLQDKFDDAMVNFDKALEKSPTWPLPYQNQALVYSKKGMFAVAIEHCKKALDLNPSFTAIYDNLSFNYQELGEIDQAIECDLKLISVFQQDICEFYNNAGDKYYRKGNESAALEYFFKAIECDSNNIISYINISVILCNRGDNEAALKILHSIPKAKSSHPIVLNELGFVHQSSRDYGAAETAYKQAISMDSFHAANYNLALLYLEQNKGTLAISYFDYYLQNINDRDSWAFFENACAHALITDLAGFKGNMQKAIDLGFSSLGTYENSEHLESVKKSPEYFAFLKLLQN